MEQLPRGGGEITGDEARGELAKIMNDKTHPMHAGFWRSDKAVQTHIDELYRKAYGTKQVDVSQERSAETPVNT